MVGGGVDLSCCFDLRIASADAFFCIKEVDIGLAADLGTLQRLPKLLGNQSLLRDMAYTARRVPAEEMQRAGFVSEVHPDQEVCCGPPQTADQLCRNLANAILCVFSCMHDC